MAFLSVNGYPRETYPPAAEIHKLIENLSEDKDSFIIAEKQDGNIFIQCCKTDGKFILQYDDGTKLSKCKETSLNVAQIVNIFQAFNSNSTIWKSRLTWEEVDLNSYSMPGIYPELIKFLRNNPWVIVVSIAIVVVAAILGCYHFIPFIK
ncbi:MAG TPA: hypothetical protein VKF42_02590 [Chitinivibrionales bacterium]|jgi:hypothetical protein|nr:hypothetical protein [Chitinivibrionales bacterium]